MIKRGGLVIYVLALGNMLDLKKTIFLKVNQIIILRRIQYSSFAWI
jgi:hypothetical protein